MMVATSPNEEVAHLTTRDLVDAALDCAPPFSIEVQMWLALIRFELFCREREWWWDFGRSGRWR
jgi:hypothetical protein